MKYVGSIYDSPANAYTGVFNTCSCLKPNEYHQFNIPTVGRKTFIDSFEKHIAKNWPHLSVSVVDSVSGKMMKVEYNPIIDEIDKGV